MIPRYFGATFIFFTLDPLSNENQSQISTPRYRTYFNIQVYGTSDN
jgi:hypothetical protein